jgi:hypothetical protein
MNSFFSKKKLGILPMWATKIAMRTRIANPFYFGR